MVVFPSQNATSTISNDFAVTQLNDSLCCRATVISWVTITTVWPRRLSHSEWLTLLARIANPEHQLALRQNYISTVDQCSGNTDALLWPPESSQGLWCSRPSSPSLPATRLHVADDCRVRCWRKWPDLHVTKCAKIRYQMVALEYKPMCSRRTLASSSGERQAAFCRRCSNHLYWVRQGNPLCSLSWFAWARGSNDCHHFSSSDCKSTFFRTVRVWSPLP